MKHTKTNFAKSLLHFLVWGYFILMLAGFPFFFNNGYTDLTEAKRVCFQYITIVFLTIAACLGVLSRLKPERSSRHQHMSRTDRWALAFGIATVVSCILSPAGAEAFWGKEGRKMGGLFLLLCIGVYFAVSRYYKPKKWIFWLFFGATVLMWLLVACNFWGWDVLNMRSHLPTNQKSAFLGTLGNINVNAGYTSVTSALMLGFYHQTERRRYRHCFFAASVLGIYSCYCTSSDSWLLALGGALLLLLMVSMGEKGPMLRWVGCGCAFLCASLAMRLTVLVANAANLDSSCIRYFQKQHILYSLTSFRTLAAGALLLALLFGIIHTPLLPLLKKYGNKILCVLLILALVWTAFSIFPLKDNFGTNRGYIWKRTIANFKEFPFWQKLFGYGPNCFLQSMEERFGAQMRQLYQAPFLDAHNEFLQMLTVTGLFGAVSYLGILLSLLASCLKKAREETLALAGFLGIAAYLLQGLVNNPAIFTLPLLFLLCGVLEQRLRQLGKPGKM